MINIREKELQKLVEKLVGEGIPIIGEIQINSFVKLPLT